MQKLYWRPAHVSRVVHVLVALIAGAVLLSAERFQAVHVQPHFEEKLSASRRMERGIDVLRTHRVRHTAPVDVEIDPTGSGLVGVAASSITTSSGSLEAKRTTANPNWAAAWSLSAVQSGINDGPDAEPWKTNARPSSA